ncbi:hypothetical protein FEZ32_02295 [Acidipropionibacterium jensenii]|nr:hypothetical protein FEZ32_02295 [Acidipropionibacterium jensenii]
MKGISKNVRRVSDLVREGMSHEDVARCISDGSMTTIRHGAVSTGPPGIDERELQLDLIEATLPVLGGDDWVLSHVSAAALLGLPMTKDEQTTVWVTKPPGDNSRHRKPWLVTRTCRITPQEICDVRGVRVTSPERTAVDMAREFGFVTGVMIADAVLGRGGSAQHLQELTDRAFRRPGNRAARRVAEFADPAPESPGESLMRAMLEVQGCPRPVLQFIIRTPDGQFVARTDFGWPEFGVIGEYDGPEKYGRLLRPGQTVSDVVVAEKDREAAIRDQGFQIIRFSAADLRNPRAAAYRLRRLIYRTGPDA